MRKQPLPSFNSFILFIWASAFGHGLMISSNNSSTNTTDHAAMSSSSILQKLNANGSSSILHRPSTDRCTTFALLHDAISYYSSLSNLSFCLGLNQTAINEASGLPMGNQVARVKRNQPLLIPIECRCTRIASRSGTTTCDNFEATVTKTAVLGESFEEIAASFEGLTSYDAIKDKNPGVPSPWVLPDKARVLVPLLCACPIELQRSQGTELFLSYPICEGDTLSGLASVFNTSVEAILSANSNHINKILGPTAPERQLPIMIQDLTTTNLSSIVIPLRKKLPIELGPLVRYHDQLRSTRLRSTEHQTSRGRKLATVYIAVGVGAAVVAALCITAAAAAVLLRRRTNKDPSSSSKSDVELQQLSTHGLLISPEAAVLEQQKKPKQHDIFHVDDVIQIKEKVVQISRSAAAALLQTFTLDELKKATEDFSPSNLIEGSVFQGRLNGKNLAIKQTDAKTISKLEYKLFNRRVGELRAHDHHPHQHPNILQLLGTCLGGGGDSCSDNNYLVFEYAKNGSLKDWLHGGLAMKSQFIASCYCFLTWSQRLRICLHVALGLQYMHHTMEPSYVHNNIKSRNILLDEEFNAKIANFGMSKCSYHRDSMEEPHLQTTQPANWSRGYLAPELVEHGTVSPCADVYAFGVVMLEVISGRTPINRDYRKGQSIILGEQIKSVLDNDREEELREWMDSAIGEACSFGSALCFAKIARACVEEDPWRRPSAQEIVDKLGSLVDEFPQGHPVIPTGEPSSKTQLSLLDH